MYMGKQHSSEELPPVPTAFVPFMVTVLWTVWPEAVAALIKLIKI